MRYQDQIRFPWFQHVLFWIIYLLFWSVRDLVHNNVYLDNVKLNIITSALYASLAYINVYILVPRYLLSRKYLVYLITLSAGLAVIAISTSQIVSYFMLNINDSPRVAQFFSSPRGLIVVSSEAVLVTLITLAIILTRIYFIQDITTQELKKKSLETELSFLKNQINPHFLFNSLNSIYFLITKSPKKASDMLLKFSDMLSHQLYEGNRDYIPLDEELKYLENYIELEKLRKGDALDISWKVEGDTSKHEIGPMILLTFLENAFKHGYVSDAKQVISGTVEVSSNEIHFELKNESINIADSTATKKGVGLDNTIRRLELLYPGRHSLVINPDNGYFSVSLIIKP
ncbi:MAG: histidine kinase [Bacteroidetes bacterium]|nr:histidine kinase [Bacteroidota bacterium]MDA1121650.1 histidine kinase [Bacteroidota bacterium]